VACIHDAGDHLVIDPVRCVDCGACISACPVSAIFHEDRLPTEWADWLGINARATGRAPRRQATGSGGPGLHR
jgi:ferredoxin